MAKFLADSMNGVPTAYMNGSMNWPMTNSTMDKSMLNLVKRTSIEDLRTCSDYEFQQLAISVETKYNHGIVQVPYMYRNYNFFGDCFTNKCCFISIYDGLISLGVTEIRGEIITPFVLMQHAYFMEENVMFDTDNETHVYCMEALMAGLLRGIQVHFYIGKEIDGEWKTTPDPVRVFGTLSNKKSVNGNPFIIRVLNKNGIHFEYITSPGELFVRDSMRMTLELAVEEQKKIEEHFQGELQSKALVDKIINEEKW